MPWLSGEVAVNGTLVLPDKAGELPSGTFTVTQARLDLPNRPGVLATSGAALAYKEGLTRDIKRTAFYEKPSEKRARERAAAFNG